MVGSAKAIHLLQEMSLSVMGKQRVEARDMSSVIFEHKEF